VVALATLSHELHHGYWQPSKWSADISPTRITATIFTKRCIAVKSSTYNSPRSLMWRIHGICFRRSVPSLQTDQYHHYKKQILGSQEDIKYMHKMDLGCIQILISCPQLIP
uniref:Uncharacterized protein n=1 Tax=Triticum urartu TaxID=4572 RepID=A0A8R7QNM4_TRIUA